MIAQNLHLFLINSMVLEKSSCSEFSDSPAQTARTIPDFLYPPAVQPDFVCRPAIGYSLAGNFLSG